MKDRNALLIIASAVLLILSAFMVFLFPDLKKEPEQAEETETPASASIVYEPDDSISGPDGKTYIKRKGVETILVLGVDQADGEYETTGVGGQADLILIASVDHKNREYAFVPINRDTMTLVNVLNDDGEITDSVFQQVCLAHSYCDGGEISCLNMADAVSYIMGGLKIDRFAAIGMDDIGRVNDAVGGVDVLIEGDLTGADPSFIDGTTVHLTGDASEKFVRARMNVGDEDNSARMKRQKQYLEAFMKKAMEKMREDSSFAVKMYKGLKKVITTDLTDSKASGLMEDIYSYSFKGYYEITGNYQVTDFYKEFYPDDESVMNILISLFYEEKTD